MNAVAFAERVGNQIGWIPKGPRLKATMAEARKLKDYLVEHPAVTWDDLMLAAEWVRRKQVIVRSPYGVIFHVEAARKAAGGAERAEDELNTQVRQAIETEFRLRLAGWEHWTSQLVRAQGPGRVTVLASWQAERATAVAA